MTTTLDIEPEYREALRVNGLVSFRDFMDAAAGPAVSEHRVRSTAPLDLQIDGRPRRFFLKRNRRVPLRHSLAPLLHGRAGYSQPRREWEVLGRLREAGVPAMKRVACGERRFAGIPVEAFLLVEAVDMEWTLEDWLVPGFAKPGTLSPVARIALFAALGGLLRGLRNTGLAWPDVHPKHIFARHHAAEWRFCLIDVERMEARHSGDSTELRCLIQKLRPLVLTRSELKQLYAGFDDVRAERISAAGPRLPDDFEHPRTLRMQSGSKMMRDERMIALLQQSGLNSLDDVFRYESHEPLSKPGLKNYRDRCRVHLQNGKGPGKTFYLKRYRAAPLVEQVRRIREAGPGLSTAGREMRAVRKLSEIGVPTMKVIAVGQEMRGMWERRSFAMTEGIEGPSLERLLLEAKGDPSRLPSWRERREIVVQLALIARLMHDHGLFHRDLYLCHFLLTRNADGGTVLRVIDLARMIEKPIRRRRWQIKDLAALDYSAWGPLVTRADRIRFLKAYLGEGASREALRREIEAVRHRVEQMARHDRRRQARDCREANA